MNLVLPIDAKGIERCWRWEKNTLLEKKGNQNTGQLLIQLPIPGVGLLRFCLHIATSVSWGFLAPHHSKDSLRGFE